MARINNKDKYPDDSKITPADFLVGSDGNDMGKTRSYPINDIVKYVQETIDRVSPDHVIQVGDLYINEEGKLVLSVHTGGNMVYINDKIITVEDEIQWDITQPTFGIKTISLFAKDDEDIFHIVEGDESDEVNEVSFEDIPENSIYVKSINIGHDFIKIIESNSLSVTKTSQGTYKIETIGQGSSINTDWYLDSNFNRPSTWEPSEIIDGVPIPTGFINDPFKTFQEYKLKVVGVGSNSFGVFTEVNPKYEKNLNILTDVSTSLNIETNSNKITLHNNILLTYTGSQDYAVDVRRLLVSSNVGSDGIIVKPINFTLAGEGRLTRSSGIGIIRTETSNTLTSASKPCILYIQASGTNGIHLIEPDNIAYLSNLNQGTTSNPVYHGNIIVRKSTLDTSNTISIFSLKGRNTNNWSCYITGTKFNVTTKTQTAISVDNSSLVCSANIFSYEISSVISNYSKILYPTLSGMTEDEEELLDMTTLAYGNTIKTFMLPKTNRYVFKLINTSDVRIESIRTASNQGFNTSVDSLVYLGQGSNFYVPLSFEDAGGGRATKIVDTDSLTKSNIEIVGGDIVCLSLYLYKGFGTDNLSMILVDTIFKGLRKIVDNVHSSFSIVTRGTLSSIKNNPIITLYAYPDNASAISAGLIKGMLYRNSSTNEITQVQ